MSKPKSWSEYIPEEARAAFAADQEDEEARENKRRHDLSRAEYDANVKAAEVRRKKEREDSAVFRKLYIALVRQTGHYIANCGCCGVYGFADTIPEKGDLSVSIDKLEAAINE